MMRSLTTLTVLLWFFPILAPQLSADALWDRAMIHASPEDTTPLVGMIMEGYQSNKAGEITKNSVIEMAVDPDTGEMVIISAFEDDKDVTDKQIRRTERNSDEDGNSDFVHPIFDPENSENLIMSPAGYDAVIHGRECAVYNFNLTDERKMGPGSPKTIVEEGQVYLEKNSGMPLRLQSRMIDGPNAIKMMTFTLEAFAGPDGSWRPDKIHMEFAGQMIIYMAGNFTMSFIYNDI